MSGVVCASRRRPSGWDALGPSTAACGLRGGDTASFALGNEVATLLDLSQDPVALNGLAEAREKMLSAFAVSKVY
jgi:hypothetical protein